MSVAILVAMPAQLLCWWFHDRHNVHLFLMASVLRQHRPRTWEFIKGKIGLGSLAIVGGSTLYILLSYIFIDMKGSSDLGLYASYSDCAISLTVGTWFWGAPAISVILSFATVLAGHYAECLHLKAEVHNNYLKYVPGGDALYDLHVVFLRIVETSETWSKVVLWSLTASSACFFIMLFALVNDGIVYSLYPPNGILLTILWVPAMASGSVTARFVQIYISINTRSPLLLPEADLRNYNQRVLRRREKSVVEGSDKVSTKVAAAAAPAKMLSGEELEKYSLEHLKLLELCKHLEDIFGIRVLGMKVTAAQILQLATFYGTGATLIIQNSAAWKERAELD